MSTGYIPLTGNVNNYDITGVSDWKVLKFVPTSAHRTITGVYITKVAREEELQLTVSNESDTYNLVLANMSGSSDAVNKIFTGTVASLTIPPYGQVNLYYNNTDGNWEVLSGTAIAGAQGVTGAVGANGVTGSQGTAGITGVVGITGTVGITGIRGITGVTGNVGADGLTGANGLTGTQGIQGLQGYTGIPGLQGETGVVGITGTQGITGIQGITGLQGETGLQGITGLAP